MNPATDSTKDAKPDEVRIPYQLPFPIEAQTEIVQLPVIPTNTGIFPVRQSSRRFFLSELPRSDEV
jgi:hypothetical protein